jgi:hypothetical protein
MTISRPESRSTHWLALAAGPAAWVANTQVNYALAPFVCGAYGILVPVISFALGLISLAGSVMAWRSLDRTCAADAWLGNDGGHSRQFLSVLGLASGFLFAIVIVNQAVASLIIGDCLR